MCTRQFCTEEVGASEMIEEAIVASSLSPLGGFMSWFTQGETDCMQLVLCNSEDVLVPLYALL